MLRQVNNKTVEGAGFLVTIPNIHEIRYVEHDRELSIEIEGGVRGGSVHWYIYSSTLKNWLPPHNQHALTDGDRKRVLANISDSLRLLGLDFEID